MTGQINKIIDRYILFVNKKPVKQIVIGLLFLWTGLIFFSYSYNYRYFYPLNIIAWMFFALTFLGGLIFGFKKKIDLNIFSGSHNNILKRKTCSIKLKYLLIFFPILSILAANAFLFVLSAQGSATIKWSWMNILYYEANIAQKILILIIFYYLFFLLIYAAGRKLLKLLKINFDSKIEQFVFAVGLGFVPFIFGTFFISLAGWLYSWTIWLMAAIVALFSYSELKKIPAEFEEQKFEFNFLNGSQALKTFAALAIFTVFLLNFVIIIKPIPITTDDLHTYFNAPDLFSYYHKYRPLMHIPIANMGQNTEMIYSAIVSALDPRFIIHFQLAFLALCLASFYILFKKIFGEKHAIMTTFAVFFIPWNFYYTSTVKVEFFLAFYSALALLSFLQWRENKNLHTHLRLFGVFSGIALGIKYTAALIIAPLLIFTAMDFLFNVKKNHIFIKQILFSLILMGIFFSPWAIKNLYYFGNPIYPYPYLMENKINTNPLSSDKSYKKEREAEITNLRHSFKRNDYSIISAIRTFWDQSVGERIDLGNWINFGFIPILIIPFYVLMLKDKKIFFFLFIIFFYFLFWYLLGAARPWYAFFGIMLLYAILPYILLQNKYYLALYSAISVLIVVINSYITVGNVNSYVTVGNVNYLIGVNNVSEYKYNNISYLKTAEYINSLNLPRNDKILLLLDFRVAHIKRNDELVVVDPYLAISGYALNQGDDFFKNYLEKSSIKYILYNEKKGGEYKLWLDDKKISYDDYITNYKKSAPSIYQDTEKIEKFLNGNCQLIFDGGYKLYKINE